MRRHAQRRDGMRAVNLAGQAQHIVLGIVVIRQAAGYALNRHVAAAISIQNRTGNLRAGHADARGHLLPVIERGIDLELGIERQQQARN